MGAWSASIRPCATKLVNVNVNDGSYVRTYWLAGFAVVSIRVFARAPAIIGKFFVGPRTALLDADVKPTTTQRTDGHKESKAAIKEYPLFYQWILQICVLTRRQARC